MVRNFNIEKGLRVLKGKIKEIKLFGFDIETCNNNKKFVCCSVVGDDYKTFFITKKDFKKEITSNRIFRNSFICATNLLFDFFGMFGLKEALEGFTIIERSGSVVFAKTYISYNAKDNKFYSKIKLDSMKKEGLIKSISDEFYPVTFIDSLNHLSASVDNLGKIIGLPKLSLPDGMLGNMPTDKKEWELMKEYNIRDSEVTFKFMKWLQHHYNKLGANLKITISSTAMDLYRRSFHKSFWKQEQRERIDLCYDSYYGGRTEAFKRGLFSSENYGKVKVFDINSLYPYCLEKFTFPIPNTSYLTDKLSTESVENFNGVGKFKMKVPKDINIPIIPYKTDKLLFPVGEIEGYYDFNTIRLALNNGCEIIETGKGLVYENVFSPFKGFVKDLYKLKLEFKKLKNSTELVPKILMNSFYGKFGYNYKNKETLGNADDVYFSAEETTIYPTRDKDVFRLVTGDNSVIPSYVFPIFPLYVTSYARQVMYKKFKSTGFDRVLYSDTDCIFTTRNLSTSNDIGELKLEETFDEVIIVRPKFYAGIFEDKKSLIKVKGLHGSLKNYETFKDLVARDKFDVQTQHFRKLRGSIGHKNKYVNQVYSMAKSMGLDDDKRIWDNKKFTIKNQNSKPIIIK